MNDFGLYVIVTNPSASLEHIAEVCVANRVRMLQIRDKNGDAREILAACRRIASITAGSDTTCIVNDRADLAVIADADGLHVGQEDLTVVDVRHYFPSLRAKIIGLSTHSLAQVSAAALLRPSYIGFGPIFPTFAKKKPDPAVGTNLLRRALDLIDVPVVAIGGINRKTIPAVLSTGVRNVAMISALMQADDLAAEIRFFQDKIG